MTKQQDRPRADERRSDTVRRLQVGITGLVLVALLVGLSTLLTSEARQSAGSVVGASPSGTAAGGANTAAAEGALTDLGVEPASSEPALEAPVSAETQAPTPAEPLVPDLQPDPQLRVLPRR